MPTYFRISRMNFLKRISIVSALFLSALGFGQTDSIATPPDSTSQVTTGDDFARKLAELEKQRFADSIRRADLEARLNDASSINTRERSELEAQLKEFEEKENQLLQRKKDQIAALKETTI